MGPQLSERDRAVLREVVKIHVETGTPVSSRALAKSGRFALSPASIRNIMADLTDLGYLAQPHTSAGRVPTDLGYRYYIDELMSPVRISGRERELIRADLSTAGTDLSRLFHAASRLLARLSGEIGLVIAPDTSQRAIRSIHFVPISARKVLAVQVTEGDIVLSRMLELESALEVAELERIGRYLTETFGGMTLPQMRRHLIDSLAQEKARYDALLGRALALARSTIAVEEPGEETIFVEGADQLLEKPEFADAESMRRLFRTFEEKARLLELINQCIDAEGARVVIGSESPFLTRNHLALVATPYGPHGERRGMVGVVGPTRMPYSRVISVVETLSEALSGRLETSPTEARGDSADDEG
jgi:heat-inducible transcriptional repressor